LHTVKDTIALRGILFFLEQAILCKNEPLTTEGKIGGCPYAIFFNSILAISSISPFFSSIFLLLSV
jgi:hypothetical protein